MLYGTKSQMHWVYISPKTSAAKTQLGHDVTAASGKIGMKT